MKTEHKKQVWLRPDQVDLTVECLKYVRGKLNEDHAQGTFARVAGPYTYRRITEILALFEPEPIKVDAQGNRVE